MPEADPPDTRYDVTLRRDVRIPTAERDVTLSGDLFLPVGAGPRPLLLTVLPYRRDLGGMVDRSARRWFAARGYPSLLVDFRGTGSSDGAPRAPFDPDEADDALAAMDWAVRQPWCDGTVGMWGISYGAIMAMRVAARRPSALRAIVPMMGMIDPGRDFVHPGGTRGALAAHGTWALSTLVAQLLPPLDDYADPEEQRRWRRRLGAEPYLLDLHRHGPGDPAWDARRIDASAIDVPALCVTGWRDLFVDGMVRAYERMRGPKRLIAGPWMHTMPQDSPFAPIDFLEEALAWWDRWLRGVPNGAGDAAPVSLHVQGHRPRWLAFRSWPPEGTTLAATPSVWERAGPPTPDPAVGALSGLWAIPTTGYGLPLDQRDDDARSHCHTSPPLEAPLLIGGRPRVRLARFRGRISVKLADVDPAGRSTLICAGLAVSGTGTDGGEDGIDIDCAPIAYEVAAGHRLRLVIATGDFPRVWPVASGPGGPPAVLTLALPLASTGAATTLDHPPPAGDPADPGHPAGGAEWEIRTGGEGDAVSVRLAETFTARPSGRTHCLRQERELIATARRAHPEASAIDGYATTTVRTETGAQVTVHVELSLTPTTAEARGRITVDGETVLDRRWHGRHPSDDPRPQRTLTP